MVDGGTEMSESKSKIEIGETTITLQLRDSEPLIFSLEALRYTQETLNKQMREYCAQVLQSAYLLGRINVAPFQIAALPNRVMDPRVIELARSIGYRAQELDDLFKEAYAFTGATLDQCIAFVGNDPSRIRNLAYCLSITKHWKATNLAQLRSQGLIPEK